MDNIYNLNIEKAVLSSLLFDYELVLDVMNVLKPSDLYLPAHQKVYETMLNLYSQGMPIDEDFIRKRVDAKTVSDSVLIEILSANPISNVMSYVKEIKDGAIKRLLVTLATDIKKLTIEDDITADAALEQVQLKLNYISNQTVTTNLREIDTIVDDFHRLFVEASSNSDAVGVKSGISSLDFIIGAFTLGDLIVIGARPSMGKTALSTTITDSLLIQGHGVLFDSLEMDGDKLMRRLIATHAREDLRDLKKGVCKDINKVNSAMSFYKSMKQKKSFVLHDMSYPTIGQLRAKAIKVFRKNPNIKIWVIDHIRYIKMNIQQRHLEVGNVTKELKSIAKEYGITIFLLSQLNRDVQQKSRTDHRPALSDLRDSGAIEEDADIIIFPHRPSYYTRTDPAIPETPINEAELIVAKNRDGATGVAKCKFIGPSTLFVNSYDMQVQVTEFKPDTNVSMPDIDMG